MSQLFSNVRILDFTQFLAGPRATWQRGLMGANIVKVEPISGEDTRRSALEKSQEWSARGLAPDFMAINEMNTQAVPNRSCRSINRFRIWA